jgi:hypothetical protein
MLDGDLDNRLRMHSFHGISARHIPECALKSPVGKVRSHHTVLRMGTIIPQPLDGMSLCRLWAHTAAKLYDGGALLAPFLLRFRDPHQAAARTPDRPASPNLTVE